MVLAEASAPRLVEGGEGVTRRARLRPRGLDKLLARVMELAVRGGGGGKGSYESRRCLSGRGGAGQSEGQDKCRTP